MTEGEADELLESLRRCNPVPTTSLSGRRALPQAVALREAILGGELVGPRTAYEGAGRDVPAGMVAVATSPDEDDDGSLRASGPVPADRIEGPAGSPAATSLRKTVLAAGSARDEDSSAAPAGGAIAPILGPVLGSAAAARRRSRRRLAGTPEPLPARSRPLWRRPVALVPTVAVLAAAAALAAAGGNSGVAPVHPGQPEDVLCFATPALSSSLEVVGAATGSPVQRCEASWRAGLLGRSTPPAHLVTCVLLSGAYAVFPADGDDVCTRQGLPAALPPSAGATAEQRLTVALTQLDNRDVCATVPEARSVVTGDLRHLGLSGWKVEVISPAQPKLAPCAQAAVLNVQSEVAIISVGRLSPPAS